MLLQSKGAALDCRNEAFGNFPFVNLLDKPIDDVLERRLWNALFNAVIRQDLNMPLGKGYE